MKRAASRLVLQRFNNLESVIKTSGCRITTVNQRSSNAMQLNNQSEMVASSISNNSNRASNSHTATSSSNRSRSRGNVVVNARTMSVEEKSGVLRRARVPQNGSSTSGAQITVAAMIAGMRIAETTIVGSTVVLLCQEMRYRLLRPVLRLERCAQGVSLAGL
jgi:hypothetical protein